MITLTGIFSESFGGTCTIRGYARYKDIVDVSFPHPDYQRPVDQRHIDEISDFILSGSNSFSPEVVLAYTTEYDYYAKDADSSVDAVSDIRSGKGFSSNKNGVSFKKERAIENGYLYEIKIAENSDNKPFRRIDGNHRLKAFEKLINDGQVKSNYLIPFCIILFAEGTPLRDEKIIFHNINSKAVPIKSEQLLNSVVIEAHSDTDFTDEELKNSFGTEYVLVRKLLISRPLLVRKLKRISWAKESILTVAVDIIQYLNSQHPVASDEDRDALFNGLKNAIDHAKSSADGELTISSGLLYLLASLYYAIELDSLEPEQQNSVSAYKDNLLRWVKKYHIFDAQSDSVETAAVNAECIKQIFEKYSDSLFHTIFLSRCFSAEYDENEHTINRVIKEINDEHQVSLRMIRVDQHSEGATGQISDRVLKNIAESGLVIADLSSGRPNIPHEIGFAMGLGKGLIIIHNGSHEQAEEHTPSNIKMYEQIRFNGDYQTLHDELKKHLLDYYKL